jgi:ABC-2 type transport system ATP-binding protein
VPVAIRFEAVSKSFRIRQTKHVKEMLLGVSGHRGRSVNVQAVHDLSLDIEVGESVALLGHNGSGKSTTLKMLAGTVAPSSGRIWARGRIAPLLELGAGFHPDLTGRENVFLNSAILGISRPEVVRRLDEIVDFAEVESFLDTPVKFYSSGMAVRLGFAIAVNVEPDILLVDEVLAVGDEQFQAKCLARMEQLQGEGRTTVLVTHSLSQAAAFCARGVVLDHGRCTYDGALEQAADAYHASSRSGVTGDPSPIP